MHQRGKHTGIVSNVQQISANANVCLFVCQLKQVDERFFYVVKWVSSKNRKKEECKKIK